MMLTLRNGSEPLMWSVKDLPFFGGSATATIWGSADRVSRAAYTRSRVGPCIRTTWDWECEAG